MYNVDVLSLHVDNLCHSYYIVHKFLWERGPILCYLTIVAQFGGLDSSGRSPYGVI